MAGNGPSARELRESAHRRSSNLYHPDPRHVGEGGEQITYDDVDRSRRLHLARLLGRLHAGLQAQIEQYAFSARRGTRALIVNTIDFVSFPILVNVNFWWNLHCGLIIEVPAASGRYSPAHTWIQMLQVIYREDREFKAEYDRAYGTAEEFMSRMDTVTLVTILASIPVDGLFASFAARISARSMGAAAAEQMAAQGTRSYRSLFTRAARELLADETGSLSPPGRRPIPNTRPGTGAVDNSPRPPGGVSDALRRRVIGGRPTEPPPPPTSPPPGGVNDLARDRASVRRRLHLPPGGRRIHLTEEQARAMYPRLVQGARGTHLPQARSEYELLWHLFGGDPSRLPPYGFRVTDAQGHNAYMVYWGRY